MLILMMLFPAAAWAAIVCILLDTADKGPWRDDPGWLVAIMFIATLISALLGFYVAFRTLWIPDSRFTLWLGILCGFAFTPVLGIAGTFLVFI
jgi:hypothetical protein